MPELLLELFCEEIPARMQGQAASDLQRLATDGLKEAGLEFSDAKSFATPRRLALVVGGLPRKSPPVREERKGPRVGAPDKAVEGFLRSAGLKTIDEAQVVTDAKKGDYYVAVMEAPGRATPDVIAELVPKVVRRFPWPKAQRWGAGSLRWVRPLHSILCVFASRTVPFEVDGIASGKATRGHRFMGAKSFSVKGFNDYTKKLREHYVILDAKEREQVILKEAKKAAAKKKLDLVEDPGLLAENAGLVEWPVVLMGAFDEGFLDVPPEVIVTAIRKHQKCFSVQDRRSGKLANRFILVSNLVAEDGGRAIVAGNERVIRARLSDAMFFWDQDRTVKLEDRLPALAGMIFHEKLGTQAERVERLKRLARALAPVVGADPDKAERAAALCKADLVTEMVGEFPDLQGIMGRYYALEEGEDEAVAEAIAQHYRPQGPNDAVPTDPVAVTVALADKLDMLVGFWAIGEKPTGSKDPYALRRATLGIVRIVLESNLKLQLRPLLAAQFIHLLCIVETSFAEGGWAEFQERSHTRDEFVKFGTSYAEQIDHSPWSCVFDTSEVRLALDQISHVDAWLSEEARNAYERANKWLIETLSVIASFSDDFTDIEFENDEDRWAFEASHKATIEDIKKAIDPTILDLLSFFHDRLKVHLREQGARHDLIDAVISADGASQSHLPLDGEGRPEGPGRGDREEAITPTRPATPADLPRQGGGGMQDDLLMIVRRVEALGRFLETDDGATLLAGVKRAVNILRIEEKKDDKAYDAAPDPDLFQQEEEKALARAIGEAEEAAEQAVKKEDFEAAMRAIAGLRGPVDAFFDNVVVNADDPKLRENRLRLLNRIRAATLAVADFSKIAG